MPAYLEARMERSAALLFGLGDMRTSQFVEAISLTGG
jgi:hypothetical protein